jgi:hypothetical protein
MMNGLCEKCKNLTLEPGDNTDSVQNNVVLNVIVIETGTVAGSPALLSVVRGVKSPTLI